MTSPRDRPFLEMPVPRPFNFRLMIFSHGWVDLEPFRWDGEGRALHTVLKTGKGRAMALRITSTGEGEPGQVLRVEKTAGPRPGKRDVAAVAERVRWIFRLDEDFTSFQRRCRRARGLSWVARYGLGAFLRNGDLFEEFVKVLLTTNVSWAGTKTMNRKLMEHLGRPVAGGGGRGEARRRAGEDSPLPRAFPDPEDIAAAGEAFLREKIRVGYRAPFLAGFARSVASGEVRLEAFAKSPLDSAALAKELSRLKGFGPYAVSALLLALGRYDRLILDSWIRKKARERHFGSTKASDAEIEAVYAPWGRWKTLACWFDCAYDTWFKEELQGERKRGKVPGGKKPRGGPGAARGGSPLRPRGELPPERRTRSRPERGGGARAAEAGCHPCAVPPRTGRGAEARSKTGPDRSREGSGQS